MFGEIFSFELKYQLKRPLVYIFFAVFFIFSFLIAALESITITVAIGNIHRNAPSIIMAILLASSIYGVFIVPAFITRAIIRDFEWDTYPVFFSTPVSRFDYLAGRFCGGMTILFIAISGAVLGNMTACFMPWLDPARLGPFDITVYIRAFLIIIVPNFLFIGAICFSMAILTRSMLYTYVVIVFLIILLVATGFFAGDIEHRFLVSLIDPFGRGSVNYMTMYWTPLQRNTMNLPFTGNIMANRFIWAAISAFFFLFSYKRFRFSTEGSLFLKGRKKGPAENITKKHTPENYRLPFMEQQFTFASLLKRVWSQSRIDFRTVLKSLPFIVILVMGIISMLSVLIRGIAFYGTKTYPVTAVMLRLFDVQFVIFSIIVIIVYAGELVWKERQNKVNEMYDSLPSPYWLPPVSKLISLIMAVAFMLVVYIFTAMAFQVASGFYDLEPLLYFKGMFLLWLPRLALMCVLGIFLHVIANSKFIGYLLMAAYLLISVIMATALDMEHHLYRFGSAPATLYSDMNGYGHFIKPLVWFYSYWSLFSVLLMVLCLLLWIRGTDDSLKIRLKIMANRFTRPVAITSVIALAGFLLCGSYIFYNTNVLNRYRSREQGKKYQAEYEKTYKYIKEQDTPMPVITDIKCNMDIYPDKRRVDIRGTYALKNKSSFEIEDLFIYLSPDITINEIKIPGGYLFHEDKKYGQYTYRLKEPMRQGGTLVMSYDLSSISKGFVNRGTNTRVSLWSPLDEGANNRVVYNGTFISNATYFPHFGYNEGLNLYDPNDRKKYGLPRYLPYATGYNGRMTYPGLLRESDRVSYDATVSTSPGQIAITCGSLKKEWQNNGRRYFHYVADRPILNAFPFMSADYKVKKDKWNDVDIEVYYDEKHPYNVDRMIYSVKKSLDYFTANFSPYQYKQVRIIEFPWYETFAQAFPGTIPYSESAGFIADIDKKNGIDTVFMVTAHEVSHQWWAHQVTGIGAGATFLTETLAQYSSMMVMKKEYGKEHMRKFLKYELDNYLRGRTNGVMYERELENVGYIPFVHYNKGSVVMYALQDYLGEEKLNHILAGYIRDEAFKGPPYTTSSELLWDIEKETPDSLKYIISDMFRNITLYENKVVEAKYQKTEDNRYRVTLKVDAKKFRVRPDGLGTEDEIGINDYIDIGVFSGRPENNISPGKKVLYLEKHKITKPETSIEIMVDEIPWQAGIDPYNKLIDKVPENNIKKVAQVR